MFKGNSSKFKPQSSKVKEFKLQTSKVKVSLCHSIFFYMDLLFLSKFMFNFANGFNYIHFDIFAILDNIRHTNLR